MYYNPKLEPPKAHFYSINKVAPNWVEAISKIESGPFKPYDSYKEALNSNWTGKLRWWQDGVMYEGSHLPAKAYKPLVGVQCEFGINWDTYYACDANELMTAVKTKYPQVFGAEPTYNEKLGIYSIQVHYDGRCR
jgi:hypothetical protein